MARVANQFRIESAGCGSNDSGRATNSSRLVSEMHPDGRELDIVYNSGIDTAIGRISGICDSSGSIVGYVYLGLSTVVQEADGNGVTLSYITGTGSSRYGGLDRFDRIAEQKYTNSGTTDEDLVYGYDQEGNVMTRTDNTSAQAENQTERGGFKDRVVGKFRSLQGLGR